MQKKYLFILVLAMTSYLFGARAAVAEKMLPGLAKDSLTANLIRLHKTKLFQPPFMSFVYQEYAGGTKIGIECTIELTHKNPYFDAHTPAGEFKNAILSQYVRSLPPSRVLVNLNDYIAVIDNRKNHNSDFIQLEPHCRIKRLAQKIFRVIVNCNAADYKNLV